MTVPAGWSASRNHGENLLAVALHRAGVLPSDVRQQYPIVGRYKVDFAFLEPKIALEADGWMHGHPEQQERDRRRDLQLFADIDWCTVRVDPHRPDLSEWTERFVALFTLRRGEPGLRGPEADAERSALLLPSREQLRASRI